MLDDQITILISSSVIPSHPSTRIVEETIASVRDHLPLAKVVVMLDGLRPEQEDRCDAYEEYKAALATLQLPNVILLPFGEFLHQAQATMRALRAVETPLILFVEHDTPLVNRPIDWRMLASTVLEGSSNMIRLHYDDRIHPDHQYMMRGKLTPRLIKCVQWHQRPHIATTKWYSDALNSVFTEKSRTFIEDKIYSPVACAEWECYRLTVYDPEGTGENMKCSRDLNGREGTEKFNDRLVF